MDKTVRVYSSSGHFWQKYGYDDCDSIQWGPDDGLIKKEKMMLDLSEINDRLKPLGKTFIAKQARIPHVRVYFGDDYAMVHDWGDGPEINWSIGISETKKELYLCKIKEVLSS